MKRLPALGFWTALCLAGCQPSQTSQPAQPGGGAAASTQPGVLVPGAACTDDLQCPTGRCAAAGELRYCTAGCTKDFECGPESKCGVSRGATQGECLQACTEPADCREGFRCVGAARISGISLPGGCQPIHPLPPLSDHSAGQTCQADAECGGGSCAAQNPLGASYPGNYCTARCYEDATCGQGGVCLLLRGSASAGHCLQACDPAQGCGREGYRCWKLGDGMRVIHACFPGFQRLPDYTVGHPCAADADCDPSARCTQSLRLHPFGTPEAVPAPNGYCTQRCAFDAACGAGAQCLSRIQAGQCLAVCDDAQPCREGYSCTAHLRTGNPDERVCIPEVAGTDGTMTQTP